MRVRRRDAHLDALPGLTKNGAGGTTSNPNTPGGTINGGTPNSGTGPLGPTPTGVPLNVVNVTINTDSTVTWLFNKTPLVVTNGNGLKLNGHQPTGVVGFSGNTITLQYNFPTDYGSYLSNTVAITALPAVTWNNPQPTRVGSNGTPNPFQTPISPLTIQQHVGSGGEFTVEYSFDNVVSVISGTPTAGIWQLNGVDPSAIAIDGANQVICTYPFVTTGLAYSFNQTPISGVVPEVQSLFLIGVTGTLAGATLLTAQTSGTQVILTFDNQIVTSTGSFVGNNMKVNGTTISTIDIGGTGTIITVSPAIPALPGDTFAVLGNCPQIANGLTATSVSCI